MRIICALCIGFVSVPSLAEDISCSELRTQLRLSHDAMERIGPEMDGLMTKPGIASAIERQKIAKEGLAYAKLAAGSSLLLGKLDCRDFVGRKTDWTNLIQESRELVIRYSVQSRGP